jgi:hypothetical protein
MTAARPPAPSRRAVLTMLTGAGSLALAGCTGKTVVVAPPPSPDQRLAARVAAEVRALSALYAAAVARHPALRASLAPYAAEHAAHLRALAPLAPPRPSSSPSSSSASSPASPSAAPSVPATPAATRAALVAAERAAARRRRAQCRTAGGELARLLASIAAAEAVHAALLS